MSEERTCENCGASFTRHDNEALCHFRKRLTCSPTCKNVRTNRVRRERLLADLRKQSQFPGDVPLYNGMRSLVDPEDFERVMQHIWNGRQVPDNDIWYASALIDGRRVLLHQFVMNTGPGELYDHISRDGLDNQKQNLRPATFSQNAMNRKRDRRNTSGFKGVTWNKQSSRWQAMIQTEGKLRRIGFFDSAEDAARAYDENARAMFGEFARFNFPRDGEQGA